MTFMPPLPPSIYFLGDYEGLSGTKYVFILLLCRFVMIRTYTTDFYLFLHVLILESL